MENKLFKSKKDKKEVESKEEIIALKDWHIVQNENDIKIKAGLPLPEGMPGHFLETLKTEKVI